MPFGIRLNTQEPQLCLGQLLVRELGLSGWIMLTVLELKADWLTVLLTLLEVTTVDTPRMQE